IAFDLAAERPRRRNTRYSRFAVALVGVVARRQCQPRQTIRPREPDIVLRNLRLQARRDQREVLLQRSPYPLVRILRIGRDERQVVAGRREIDDVLADDLAQLLLRGREEALGLDLRGDRAVERGLRLLDVGSRDQTHLEAPLRLLELALERLSSNDLGFERVLGREHVEIRLGDTEQRLLFCGLVFDFRLLDPLLGLFQRQDSRPIENGLVYAELPVPAVAFLLLTRLERTRDRVDDVALLLERARDSRRELQLWEQLRSCLRPNFDVREIPR